MIANFICWLIGHQQPPGLKYIMEENGVLMVQCCKRCRKTAEEIIAGK